MEAAQSETTSAAFVAMSCRVNEPMDACMDGCMDAWIATNYGELALACSAERVT
jgi:hypothetical protein